MQKKKNESGETNNITAESLKVQGNEKLAEKKYAEAVDLYSRAIDMEPSNKIFLSNRAAAYSLMGNHEKAINDCLTAIEIDPGYSKAYSRLGHAYFQLQNYEKSVEAYEKTLSLDPSPNDKESLRIAKERLGKVSSGSQSPNAGGLGNFLNNPAFAQMMNGGGGGMGALSEMMKNPEIMKMAQDVMSNPEAMKGVMDMFSTMNKKA